MEAPSPAEALDKLRGVKVGDVDIGTLAKSAVDDLRSSLKGIKDEATAQAAVPELTKDASQFDQLTGLLGQLSPETRKTLTDAFVAIKPKLDKLFDQALALPGVGARDQADARYNSFQAQHARHNLAVRQQPSGVAGQAISSPKVK